MSILTYALDNKQEIFHTVIIIIFFMFVYLKTINCLNSIDNKEKVNTLDEEDGYTWPNLL